jgi:hypothetical protein
MTLKERLDASVPGASMLIRLTPVHRNMTGVSAFEIAKGGLVSLTYIDDTTESREADEALLNRPANSIGVFDLISFVQAGRPKT